MLTDRREALTRRRVQTVNRLQALLAELLPGTGEEGHHPAAGQGDARVSAPERRRRYAELKSILLARGSRLMDIHGVGPVVAARVLADVGDVARFADRNRFASWTGTAPLDASSGEQNRHRLSRVTADTRNCPETAMKVPGGGHEDSPLTVMRSARHDSVCLTASRG